MDRCGGSWEPGSPNLRTVERKCRQSVGYFFCFFYYFLFTGKHCFKATGGNLREG